MSQQRNCAGMTVESPVRMSERRNCAAAAAPVTGAAGEPHTGRMPLPLESNFLVPNGSFIVALLVVVAMLVVLGLVIGGLVWLLLGRRGATDRR